MLNESIEMTITLPYRIFLKITGVKRIVAESHHGSFGILPNRLDCVSTIVPGILIYETEQGGETYLAVDEGVIVKIGGSVFLALQNAIAGNDLNDLHEVVKNQFLNISREEVKLRTSLAKLEMDFVRRFTALLEEND